MLTVGHIELKAANAYVMEHHRHHGAVRGHRFSLACYEDGRLCSRRIDQHMTVEVLRLCTDGTKNACSKLYGACRRAAKMLGYERLITYILADESGKTFWQAAFVIAIPTRGGELEPAGQTEKR